MKSITSAFNDLKFNIEICSEQGFELFDIFQITVFTVNQNIDPQFNKEDIDEAGNLYVSSDVLRTLPDGQLNIKIYYGISDNHYPDFAFNREIIRHTNYYLDNEGFVDHGKLYPTEWGMISGEIETQTDLVEYIDTKKNYILDIVDDRFTEKEQQIDSQLNTFNNNIFNIDQKVSDISTNVNNLITEVNNTINDISTNIVNFIDDTSTTIQNISTNLSEQFNEYKTEITENITEIINEVDLTNYYNKEEVDALIGDVSVDLTGYATEEFVMDKIGDISVNIQVGEDGNIDLTNYYNKEQADFQINLAAGGVRSYTDQLFQNIELEMMSYAPYSALNDYYNKNEIDIYSKEEVDQKISDVSIDLSDYYKKDEIDSSISNNYYNKEEVDARMIDLITNIEVIPASLYNPENINPNKIYIITA